MNRNVEANLPSDIIQINESSYVLEPWKLSHVETGIEEHGIKYRQTLNILYSVFIPSKLGRQPCLRMKHELPFWELGEDAWAILKKRAVGFSRKFPRLPDITNESLDDLKNRLTGDWYDQP